MSRPCRDPTGWCSNAFVYLTGKTTFVNVIAVSVSSLRHRECLKIVKICDKNCYNFSLSLQSSREHPNRTNRKRSLPRLRSSLTQYAGISLFISQRWLMQRTIASIKPRSFNHGLATHYFFDDDSCKLFLFSFFPFGTRERSELLIFSPGTTKLILTFLWLCQQSGNFSEDMIPTVGFNMRKVTKGNVTIKVWGKLEEFY